MLRALKQILADLANPDPASSPEGEEHRLQLATAVLLVEVMRAEADARPGEREAVLSALRRKFTLSEQELDGLVALAEEKARTANDFFGFTSTLNERFGHAQKVRMVEFMWQVAYADGDVSADENHLVSKVAGLLHVTHGEYIAAKLHARQAAGLGAP